MNDTDPQPPSTETRPSPTEGAPTTSGLSVGVAAVILVVMTVATYLNSFNGVFIFDDWNAIVDNPHIRQVFPLGQTLFGPADMRPVASLSFALNYAVSGRNTWSYHAVNLAVHVLAALALMGIVRRTLLSDRLKRTFGAAATPLGLAVALIWAVHPLLTGSVTYIVQRAESMMGMFYLLTLYAVIRGDKSSRLGWYVVAVAACAVGMGCKQVMVTVPVVALVYDRVFLSRSWRVLLQRRWGLYAALAGMWLILGGLYLVLAEGATAGASGSGITTGDYLRTQPGVIMHYIGLAFWPKGLCFDYHGWMPPASLGEALLPAITVGALLVATIVSLRYWPAVGFLGVWFFVILTPSSSFMALPDVAFEQRMYLSLAAIVTLVVVDLYRGAARLGKLVPEGSRRVLGRWLGGAALAVVVAMLAWQTNRRNALYASEVAMYADVVDKRPGTARAHLSLAAGLQKRGWPGDWAAARLHYDRCLALSDHPVLKLKAYVNLGQALVKQGKPRQAIDFLSRGAEMFREDASPDMRRNFTMLYMNLGLAQESLRKWPEAAGSYRRALEISPGFADAYAYCGDLLRRMGKLDEAAARCRRAVEIAPTSALARNRLAVVLYDRGELAEAAEQFAQVIRLAPGVRQAHADLARVQALHRACQAKVDLCRRRHKGKPGDPEAMSDLAWVLATLPDAGGRNGAEAVALAAKAVAADPKRPAFLDTLAAAQAEAGQFAEAVKTIDRAIALAEKAGLMASVADCRGRRKLYQAGRPMREKPR